MSNIESTAERDSTVLYKLGEEIKILKSTIEEFKKNKVHPSVIQKAEAELYNLKVNFDYHNRCKKPYFNPLDWFAPIKHGSYIDNEGLIWSFEYNHLQGLG